VSMSVQDLSDMHGMNYAVERSFQNVVLVL
jgi:hypothetical protein